MIYEVKAERLPEARDTALFPLGTTGVWPLSCLFCMVMTSRHAPYTARLILLVLLAVTPRLAAAPVGGEGEGRSRTPLSADSLSHRPPNQTQREERGHEEPTDAAPARALASVLLEALENHRGGGRGEGQRRGAGGEEPVSVEGRGGEEREEQQEQKRRMEQLGAALVGAELTEMEAEQEGGDTAGRGSEEGGELEEVEEDGEKRGGEEGPRRADEGTPNMASLLREARGYFQNIDLGLQDNEILPPLKGYKAYNTQLAQAGKKMHWEEEQPRNTPLGGNFMDDFENEAEEEEEELEEEALSRGEEEAAARAEQQEVQRQQEEAERAREEEQRLADIASDMLLQYMGRKQQAVPFLLARQQAGSSAAEDKRSEEVFVDADDADQQMIDRLIEISSKLHLPADDVVQIISDVEKKKNKRKELTPPSNPVAPRYRPLVPPPLATGPMYQYTTSSNKKKPYYWPSKNKWNKDKAKSKSYKDIWFKPKKQKDVWFKPQKEKDVWFKPQKEKDYWFKPQKQFLAFPSYPYYQKPYRAYYPVYYPYPKPQYYDKTPMGEELPYGLPPDYELQPTRRRHRAGDRVRGGGGRGWRQQPSPPHLPSSPYISNYILPHPRTYQPLPAPKPRRPPFYYPSSGPRDMGVVRVVGGDYEEDDGLVRQVDSQEELENFISKIYMKRRMY